MTRRTIPLLALSLLACPGAPTAPQQAPGARADVSLFDYDSSAQFTTNLIPSGSPDTWQIVHRVLFPSPDGGTVPGWLVRPKAPGVYPGVLLMHGLPGNAQGMMVAYGLEIAKRGAAFAAQAAIAMENARLYGAAQLELAGRTRAEDELRQSKARYRQIVENATDIIYAAAVSGRYDFVNPVAARLLGFSEAELLQKHYLDVVRSTIAPRLTSSTSARSRSASLSLTSSSRWWPRTDASCGSARRCGRWLTK